MAFHSAPLGQQPGSPNPVVPTDPEPPNWRRERELVYTQMDAMERQLLRKTAELRQLNDAMIRKNRRLTHLVTRMSEAGYELEQIKKLFGISARKQLGTGSLTDIVRATVNELERRRQLMQRGEAEIVPPPITQDNAHDPLAYRLDEQLRKEGF